VVAPATPITSPAVDTMPSFAPSTPARNQFSRAAIDRRWNSLAANDGLAALAFLGLRIDFEISTRSVGCLEARKLVIGRIRPIFRTN